MGKSLSVEKMVATGFWVAVAMLVGLAVVYYRKTADFRIAIAQVNRAHEVSEHLDRLLSQLTAAETGQLGYLFTGAPRYLEPYQQTITQVGNTLADIRAATADDTLQQERFDGLAPLIASKLAQLKSIVDLRSRTGFDVAQRIVLIDRGKTTTDAIRAVVADMQSAARRAPASHSATAGVISLPLVVLIVGLLALLCIATAHVVVIRGLADRRRAQETLLHSYADVDAARYQAERQASELASLADDQDQVLLAAQQASRLKSEFVANMSHEIRSPMTAILGYTEILADPEISVSDRSEYLDTIHRNGDHLLTIINDVLDLSKIEAGKMTVERIPCSPSALVWDIASPMRSRAVHKGLTFDLVYRSPIPETIESDPTRLRQILINLLGNAIKFTETGGVRLQVGMENVGPGTPPQLRFDVVDTGIGLTAEQQVTTFMPFTQGDTSTSRKFGGTGLGLTISKRLAAMMGGDISVSSTPGVGSTFTLTIETGPVDGLRMLDDPAGAVLKSVATPASRARNIRLHGRVLLAEDGPDNQRLLALHLRKARAEVAIAENGLVASRMAMQAVAAGAPFEVILMDMQMPELDGYGATARLRREGYRGPIVALTAHAMEGDREKCLHAGCDDFVTKPIVRRTLLETVEKHLAAIPASVPPALEEELLPLEPSSLVSELAADCASDPELRVLLESFVKALPERVVAMERKLAEGNLSALGALAHLMKGTAGGYGFPAITEAARHLEAVARTCGETDGALALLADLCRRARSCKAAA